MTDWLEQAKEWVVVGATQDGAAAALIVIAEELRKINEQPPVILHVNGDQYPPGEAVAFAWALRGRLATTKRGAE